MDDFDANNAICAMTRGIFRKAIKGRAHESQPLLGCPFQRLAHGGQLCVFSMVHDSPSGTAADPDRIG